jgi:hypothetical protein
MASDFRSLQVAGQRPAGVALNPVCGFTSVIDDRLSRVLTYKPSIFNFVTIRHPAISCALHSAPLASRVRRATAKEARHVLATRWLLPEVTRVPTLFNFRSFWSWNEMEWLVKTTVDGGS